MGFCLNHALLRQTVIVLSHFIWLLPEVLFWAVRLQEAEKAHDDYMLGSAKSLVAMSPQRLELTTLGGRRDMSMLLAQSAIQVPHFVQA